MNSSNEVCCPKCGSNQLTANKKGFSGKKAVGGALLTGGIGLLAGTIGSNKIIITCLNCGNQFKPGERPKVQSSNMQSGANPIATFVILGILIGFIVLIARGCNSNDNQSTTVSEKYLVDTTAKSITSSSNSTIPKPNIKYEIVKKESDNTESTNLLYVYVKSTKGIKDLNSYLINEYKSSSVVGFQIYYFNNRSVAKNYYNLLFNNNVSDAEIDRLSTHIIGHYEYNVTDGESLKLGKDAQE